MHKTSRPKKDKFVWVWDKIEIILNEADKKGIYVSRIEDIKESTIIASRPEFVSGSSLLRAGSRVYVQYKRSDAMYRFAANLKPLSGQADGKVQLYSLGEVERVQRREYVRIEKRINLKYATLKNSTSGFLLDRLTWFDSYCRDISAGGILMKVTNDIRKNDILLVRVDEYDIMRIPRFVCAVCRRTFTIDDSNYAGTEFITKENLSEYLRPEEIKKLPSLLKRFNANIQNKIVRFIFDEQIKERQKGLI